MQSDNNDYVADLSARIIETILSDHGARQLETVSVHLPHLLSALAIVAARFTGATFDQFDGELRHVHALALGSNFATIAETIWQVEAGMCFDEGARH